MDMEHALEAWLSLGHLLGMCLLDTLDHMDTLDLLDTLNLLDLLDSLLLLHVLHS